ELAGELRRRSSTGYAGVVVDRDAVPQGEIDVHRDGCMVAKGGSGAGRQAGAVGYGSEPLRYASASRARRLARATATRRCSLWGGRPTLHAREGKCARSRVRGVSRRLAE